MLGGRAGGGVVGARRGTRGWVRTGREQRQDGAGVDRCDWINNIWPARRKRCPYLNTHTRFVRVSFFIFQMAIM